MLRVARWFGDADALLDAVFVVLAHLCVLPPCGHLVLAFQHQVAAASAHLVLQVSEPMASVSESPHWCHLVALLPADSTRVATLTRASVHDCILRLDSRPPLPFASLLLLWRVFICSFFWFWRRSGAFALGLGLDLDLLGPSHDKDAEWYSQGVSGYHSKKATADTCSGTSQVPECTVSWKDWTASGVAELAANL